MLTNLLRAQYLILYHTFLGPSLAPPASGRGRDRCGFLTTAANMYMHKCLSLSLSIYIYIYIVVIIICLLLLLIIIIGSNSSSISSGCVLALKQFSILKYMGHFHCIYDIRPISLLRFHCPNYDDNVFSKLFLPQEQNNFRSCCP